MFSIFYKVSYLDMKILFSSAFHLLTFLTKRDRYIERRIEERVGGRDGGRKEGQNESKTRANLWIE